jgi:hypothetical protein
MERELRSQGPCGGPLEANSRVESFAVARKIRPALAAGARDRSLEHRRPSLQSTAAGILKPRARGRRPRPLRPLGHLRCWAPSAPWPSRALKAVSLAIAAEGCLARHRCGRLSRSPSLRKAVSLRSGRGRSSHWPPLAPPPAKSFGDLAFEQPATIAPDRCSRLGSYRPGFGRLRVIASSARDFIRWLRGLGKRSHTLKARRLTSGSWAPRTMS